MGNQQEIFDKGYIAGILDGEGTVHLSIVHYKSQHGYKPATIYKPRISVGNTNSEIIDAITTILQRYGIPFWVRNTQKTKSNKKFYVVMIEGFKRVPKFLDWFSDTPCAKRKQLETIKKFIELRTRRSLISNNGRNGYPLYGEEEHGFYRQCKDLNQRVPQRLHATHPDRIAMDEDIVQTTT